MAGPGRVPKPRHMLARPSARKSKVVEYAGPVIERPELRHSNDGHWHALTLAWWDAVWASPVAAEFTPTDTDGLGRLAVLIDRFWANPSVPLAAEIRLQEARYGLDPIARRRLQWEVRRVEGEKPKRETPERDSTDPRIALGMGALQIVK